MIEEHISNQIIRLIKGDLSHEESSEILSLIERNPEIKSEYEAYSDLMNKLKNARVYHPAEHTVVKFDGWLQTQIKLAENEKSPVLIRIGGKWWKYAIAASIVLIVGLFGVTSLFMNQSPTRQFRAQKDTLIHLVSTENTTSRIKGINQSYEMHSLDDEVRDVLLKILETDKSTNVRLAALDALSNDLTDEKVKTFLIRILEKESEPIIQISIINTLVQIKDSRIKGSLQELLDRDQVPVDVKEEAFLGITRL
jgi:hypothetical protein